MERAFRAEEEADEQTDSDEEDQTQEAPGGLSGARQRRPTQQREEPGGRSEDSAPRRVRW